MFFSKVSAEWPGYEYYEVAEPEWIDSITSAGYWSRLKSSIRERIGRKDEVWEYKIKSCKTVSRFQKIVHCFLTDLHLYYL